MQIPPEVLERILRGQAMPDFGHPGAPSAAPDIAPPPEPQGAPPPPPSAPAASDVSPPPSQLEQLMAGYQRFVTDYSPDRLAAAQGRDRANIEGNRFAQNMNDATGLVINHPGIVKTAPAVPLEVQNFLARRELAKDQIGTQTQMLQMSPGSPIAEAQRQAYNAAGFNFPPGTPPMVMDAAVKAKHAGGEASLPGAQARSADASAAAATAGIGAKQQEIAVQVAGLQKDYDLKREEIAAAAKQGDLTRATEITKQAMSIEAEMTRLRANISAENTGDADWEIGPQFSGGLKKLPPAAQEVLKKNPGARALLDNSARAEALINKHPDGVLTGNDAGDLHRWVGEMTSQLNGLWGMGILRQGNMPMLEEALADPTHLSSIVATKAKRQDFLTQLHQFQTMVKQRMFSEASGTGALTPRAGGYYGGFASVSGKDAGNGKPDDAAAAAWAKAHPEDPRAAKILSHLNGN